MENKFQSKVTKMRIVTKTNEINTKNKSFKKARYCCNGKVVIMYLSILKIYLFLIIFIIHIV